eukprot:ctg_177.g92
MNRPGRACDNRWAALDRIVIVAGHAIYLGSGDGGAQDVTAESSWALEPYQRGHVSTFLAHIETGVRVAAADNRTLLVFSGGDSRAQAGPMNEAESYWRIAQTRDWFGHADDVRWRVVTEHAAISDAHHRGVDEHETPALLRDASGGVAHPAPPVHVPGHRPAGRLRAQRRRGGRVGERGAALLGRPLRMSSLAAHR